MQCISLILLQAASTKDSLPITTHLESEERNITDLQARIAELSTKVFFVFLIPS